MIPNLAHKQRIFASVVNFDLELDIALIIHDDKHGPRVPA